MSKQSTAESARAKADEDGRTERWLVRAGVRPGMRVLDIGCGYGSVSVILARLVGPGGQVVAIDRAPDHLAVARERVEALGLEQVRFIEEDFTVAGTVEGPFDAAVGRRVLMYQADPAAAVARLTEVLRTDGLIFFEELDSTVPSTGVVSLPLHECVRAWIWKTVEHLGVQVHMGSELHGVLSAAGLGGIVVCAEAAVYTPTSRDRTADIVRFLLPRMVEHGVASEAEVDIDSLAARLVEERCRAGATWVGDLVFAAWARRGAA